jgi:alpha,alpha-trehalase
MSFIPDPDFHRLEYLDGYLPIEDHGLIGDGSTAALVGRDGVISWLCVPRFDSEPLFSGILDRQRGGGFTVQPEGVLESRQQYVGESGVLLTEMRGPDGLVAVTDAVTLRSGADLTENVAAGRGELIRSVRVSSGRVRLVVDVEVCGGSRVESFGGGLTFSCQAQPNLRLYLQGTARLEGNRTVLDLSEGDRLDLIMRWGQAAQRHQLDTDQIMRSTADSWSRWADGIEYQGPEEALVRRSAITLKLLDHFQNGAIVAAPTSSLPEAIGGVRNWDYRYTWIRDCAFSVYALRRIGLTREAEAFLGWALDAAERHGGPQIMYDIDGETCPEEYEDPDLEGYRRSAPVRWGNGAAFQTQNDVYGELLDCAYMWARGGGEIESHLWESLRPQVETAAEVWDKPDHGIWEVRTSGRVFTYSAALCQVALDRGARLAEQYDLKGDVEGWRKTAETITETILESAWDDERSSLTEHLGGGGLDASLLSLPLRRVVPPDHPKMVATCEAVVRELGAGGGLLYRYLPDVSPDGLAGEEGAFLLCSFWLVDNLAHQGRLEEAYDLYSTICSHANPLGLLPEQIDPDSGRFLGNFPQAFSHIGIIASGFNLTRADRRLRADSG